LPGSHANSGNNRGDCTDDHRTHIETEGGIEVFVSSLAQLFTKAIYLFVELGNIFKGTPNRTERGYETTNCVESKINCSILGCSYELEFIFSISWHGVGARGKRLTYSFDYSTSSKIVRVELLGASPHKLQYLWLNLIVSQF
jgi:hypothetical protein